MINSAQEFFDLVKFRTPGSVKSLRRSLEYALNQETGNINLESTMELYRSVRSNAVRILLEISGDGIGGIRYSDTRSLRYIDGNEYDDFLSHRKKLSELNELENKIRSELSQMQKDIVGFISDLVEEKISLSPQVERLIEAVTSDVVNKKLDRDLHDAKNYQPVISSLQGYFNPASITMKGWDITTKLSCAGIIYPADFVEALKSGTNVKIIGECGHVHYIDICNALRQVFLSKFNQIFYKQMQDRFFVTGRIPIKRGTTDPADEGGDNSERNK